MNTIIGNSGSSNGGGINIDPTLFYRKDQDVIINSPNPQLAKYAKDPSLITDSNEIVNKSYVDNAVTNNDLWGLDSNNNITNANRDVLIATTRLISWNTLPSDNFHLTNKLYVDNAVTSGVNQVQSQVLDIDPVTLISGNQVQSTTRPLQYTILGNNVFNIYALTNYTNK